MAAADPPLLRLRPVGVAEILDDIFRIYRRKFTLLAGISVALVLPSLLAELASGQQRSYGVLISAFSNLGNPNALGSQRSLDVAPNGFWLLVTYVLILVLIPFTIGAITQAAIDLALGRPATYASVLRGVLRRYWALLGLSLLYIVMTLSILCPPVFIFLSVRYLLAAQVALAEGVGPIRALGRSWYLTQGSFWRALGITALGYLLYSVIGGVLGALLLPLALVIPFLAPDIRGAIVITGSTLGTALAYPIFYLTLVLLYFDLRIRRESFDLDQLARQALPPGAATA